MITQLEIIDFLKKNKQFIKSEFHLSTIALFGSFSKNQQNNESDIDILVEFEPDTSQLFDTNEKLRAFLENAFNKQVDIASAKYLKPYYKDLILKDAIFI
ncbi:MAG: nucleotidyltransferase family protein [Saprospiraceae bacterium]